MGIFATHNPRAIVVTGATGGLGHALVKAYARTGTSLLLIGRDPNRLARIAEIAEQAGANVRTASPALTDTAALTAAISAFDATHPVDLLIVAAGTKTGNVNGIEPAHHLARIVDVNLTGAINTVQAALPGMLRRNHGQIALFSSMAALSPHADLLSYTATKAGLRAYGIGLRRALLDTGIGISIITPGFIDTPMTDRHKGATPFVISAERAGAIIQRGLARRAKFITFPARLAVLIFLSNRLPVWLSDWIDRGYRAEIAPDHDETGSDRTAEPNSMIDNPRA